MSTERANNPRLACPHCGSFARIRKSESMTPIYRKAVLECQNADCGWRGTLALEITQTLSPSLNPNPAIQLPISPRVRKQLLAELAPETS
ncbi:hypothetical protein CAI21_01435 [Alkalilimnicola ehrlichii]|uniref:Zinc finger Ogr/Delta-type domain-containing protein n=1 Tax=Alkalilimnicola ehrlichii TaxID=351052 RepID=A0A3E0X1P8_9GAMM|nr:ogr/Delta-like zinc finger family protein [Alkalilimnicola ehrlichii]RFA31319.1 hypothetical protein CAI21_01435 [Alkalilimnicola ehrlichii]RFA39407.1 hypothetical protein CAL65_00975 [Alkalilimnicola ehrlichii]